MSRGYRQRSFKNAPEPYTTMFRKMKKMCDMNFLKLRQEIKFGNKLNNMEKLLKLIQSYY